MAGLSLYIAANLVNKTFLMIFDEADAYLDKDNTQKFLLFMKNELK